jgi:hypothetical protein
MKLLDLFCGAGGAGYGYHLAGFDVVGVDIEPMRDYPFEFHQSDALEYLKLHGHEFDFIHASPPCQAYSKMQLVHKNKDEHPDLVAPTRELLLQIGKPFVIENVIGAPLRLDLMLCGTMFGLPIVRHRIFELSFNMPVLMPPCNHANVYDPWHGKAGQRSANKFREAMGISWMRDGGGGRRKGTLALAIPPAYTKFIGEWFLANIAQLSNTACSRPGVRTAKKAFISTGSASVIGDGSSPTPGG